MRDFLFFLLCLTAVHGKVLTGLEVLLESDIHLIENKRVGLLTHSAAVTSQLETSVDRLQREKSIQLTAIFSPEHGLNGSFWSERNVPSSRQGSIVVHSLHGKYKRPTPQMLKDIDVLIVDLQDIGARSYTYVSTLCYAMEEAAKVNLPVIVCDRPNPMGGEIVDGPLLERDYRSIVGYIDVPYCHGMTIGELARYHNATEKIGCKLTVIAMRGYDPAMSFDQTGLTWVPTSPNMPQADTPLYYPITGLIGELQIANIGIGYTLPFKIIGAPWIKSDAFCSALNRQNLPGVTFTPFHYTPYYGSLKNQPCQGALIHVTDRRLFRPIKTAYLLLSILKSHNPKAFKKQTAQIESRRKMFAKVNGTDRICELLLKEKHPGWKMVEHYDRAAAAFRKKRAPYLIYPRRAGDPQ